MNLLLRLKRALFGEPELVPPRPKSRELFVEWAERYGATPAIRWSASKALSDVRKQQAKDTRLRLIVREELERSILLAKAEKER